MPTARGLLRRVGVPLGGLLGAVGIGSVKMYGTKHEAHRWSWSESNPWSSV